MKYTREQILAMDAEQLRLAIAEAKGCSDFYVFCAFVGAREELRAKITGKENTFDVYVPHWTTKISDAFDLVDEMIANDRKFHLLRFGYLPSGSPKKNEQNIVWQACYGEQDVNLLEHTEGETAPLAICRAYLLWKEGV